LAGLIGLIAAAVGCCTVRSDAKPAPVAEFAGEPQMRARRLALLDSSPMC